VPHTTQLVSSPAGERKRLEWLLEGPLARQCLWWTSRALGQPTAADRALEFDGDIIEALASLLLSDKGSRWETEAAYLLGESGSPRAVEPLLDFVRRLPEEDPSGHRWPTRYNAFVSLGRLRDYRALPVLEARLSDPIRAPIWLDLDMPRLHVRRHAAQRAIFELTGDWRHFEGEDAFRPPRVPLKPFELKGPVSGVAYVQGGSWEEADGAIIGSCKGTGRLWLPWLLPSQYTLALEVSLDGESAGLSYGHLKDFARDYIRAPLTFEMVMWVSPVDFRVHARPAPIAVSQTIISTNDPRRVLAPLRADLGRRVALVVQQGRARFSRLDLRPGEIVPDILYQRPDED
jgi:hypothetical protein